MKNYNHLKIESKWQKEWDKKKIYQAKNLPAQTGNSKKNKFYGLMEFPYPSGDGLHVGHVRGYTAMDIISRQKRMEGYNTLFPIGWDAFGLPTENYAIKTGKQPKLITKKNTDNFKKQFNLLGMSFDWSREINTTDPAYYKWTQWIFLQFFKKGLAYKKKVEINWCIDCKIGLANEEVVNNLCERCGGEVVKKEKEQWMLAITKYADRLDKDLDLVDYPERVKSSQRNWIGRSEGSLIKFKVQSYKVESIKNSLYKLEELDELSTISIFTTRADTIFGATYVVLAPEHELIEKLKTQIENWGEVEKYIKKVKSKSDLERTENKEKTGVELKGLKAINPATKEEIPIWIADYVLVQYGTGAVMAVPQHDERDRDFAVKFNLPIIDKPLVNAKEITKKVGGEMVTKYKLRDWVFSRQRYWGEPIPLVFCQKCNWVPIADKGLPVKLPEVKNYKPTDTGESPLANISKWVNVKCPKCGAKAKRETDTMPNWAGSSWYYLRYTDPKNKKEFASKKDLKYWLGDDPRHGGVDWYNGGMEHTTLHLLYSRFWHKFLYDLKLVPTVEPYKKRTSHGMILADGGVKMSKSKGNVINPDDIIKIYGADTLRIYEMFIGPFEDTVVWNTESIIGSRRFIEKVWRIAERIASSGAFAQVLGSPRSARPDHSQNHTDSAILKLLSKTIKKVTEDIQGMHFNTAISSMMILASELEKLENINKEDFEKFLQILAPFAPHITEEIWHLFGNKKSIHLSIWPSYDAEIIKDAEMKIILQVNGKLRGEIIVPANENEDEIKKLAQQDVNVLRFVGGQSIKKIIYVKNRLVNIVI